MPKKFKSLRSFTLEVRNFNNIKFEQLGNKKNRSLDNSGKVIANSIRNVLGGDFIKRESTMKQIPFVLLLAFLALIYIGNSYFAEKNIRKIEKMQRELKELRYEYISIKSARMHATRQSEIAKQIKSKGIKESTVPPSKIVVMASNN